MTKRLIGGKVGGNAPEDLTGRPGRLDQFSERNLGQILERNYRTAGSWLRARRHGT